MQRNQTQKVLKFMVLCIIFTLSLQAFAYSIPLTLNSTSGSAYIPKYVVINSSYVASSYDLNVGGAINGKQICINGVCNSVWPSGADIYWDGSLGPLNAALGRTSLGLGSLAVKNSVDLSTADVTGNLPVTRLNSGTGADNTKFWRGDGVWAAPSASTDIYWTGTATNLVAATGRTSLGLGTLAVQNNINLANTGNVTGTLAVTNGGTGTTTSTGSGSVVLSNSPTFTGTVIIPILSITDTLAISSGAKVYLASAVNITGDLLPNVTSAFNIGSNSAKWKDAYLSGSLNSSTVTTTGAVSVGNGLTVTSGSVTLPANTVASAAVNFNYAGSSSKGGAATTALALNSVPSQCAPGYYPLGVDVNGNAVSCTLATGGSGSGANGSGTANYTARWFNSTYLSNSIIYDDGTNIGIGNSNPTQKLTVTGNILASGTVTGTTINGAGTGLTGTAASLTAGLATRLVNNGGNCPAGQYPLGVDEFGAVEGCTLVATGGVSTVSVTSPILNTGTATNPVIAIQVATSGQNGYLSSADWSTFNAKAPTASPTFTGTVTIPSPFTVGATSVTATGAEINYLVGVTSGIQGQINAKAPTASPTFTGTVTIPSPFTLGATSVTATGTEINYLSGVTSGIQAQINSKAPTASPTFTGTVTVPTLRVTGLLAVESGASVYLANAVRVNGDYLPNLSTVFDIGSSTYKWKDAYFSGTLNSAAVSTTGAVTAGNGLTVSAGSVSLPANSVASAAVNFNYAGSSSKGGAATTAVALSANGANCGAGSYPLGVDASGNAESCTAVPSLSESDTLATVTSRGFTTRTSSGAFAQAGQQTPGLEIYGAGGAEPSFMTFHRPGVYAIKLGLDGTDLKVGGWSMGNVAYKIWHEGNDGSGSTLDADLLDGYNSGTTGANVILRTEPSGYLGLDSWARVSGIYNSNGNHLGFTGAYLFSRSDNGFWVQDNSGNTRGYLYHDGASGNFGLLSSDGNWRVRTQPGYQELYGTTYMSDARSSIFYDRDNTGYYVDPASTSMLGYIGRPTHSTGYMVGSYNNVGSNDAKTNPIYTIGSSYMPTDTALNGMYGIGFSHSNFWGGGKSSGWGLYQASGGAIYNTISDGGIWSAGSVTASAFYYTSDERLKENIKPLESNRMLQNVLALKPVSFEWKNSTLQGEKLGFIAQDVEKILPQVVKTDGEGFKSVEYGNLVSPLVSAVQEQQKQFESQQKQIDAQQQQIELLRAEIEALKAERK